MEEQHISAYTVLNEMERPRLKALVKAGILRKTDMRNLLIFAYYEDKVKEMPRMDARTDTSMHFAISEESVSVIIRRMK